MMQVKPLFFETYIAVIKNSVGTKMFQTFWAEVDGEKTDVTDAGRISCGFFVSNVLLMFGLIKEGHTTVDATLIDMKNSGWEEISEPREGCVIYWEKLTRNDTTNEHIGFYIGNDEAVCNDPDEGAPHIRHWTYGETDGKPNRKVEGIYWHPKLDSKYFENPR